MADWVTLKIIPSSGLGVNVSPTLNTHGQGEGKMSEANRRDRNYQKKDSNSKRWAKS